MPVQIIFRGLILFRFPDRGPDRNKLVAELINKPVVPRRERPHEHRHDAHIQIATDHGDGDERVPVLLIPPRRNPPGERIDITFLDVDDEPLPAERVELDESFRRHVPRLSDVINAGTPNVKAIANAPRQPNGRLVRNVVTIDRGRIRVREVVPWDEGGFPLNGQQGQRGRAPASPALLKFVGSDTHGFLASECVVDVDADAAMVESSRNQRLTKDHRGRGNLNHRTPLEMVQIVISNFEYQERSPLPWGLDFQWLFEAAGYRPADLAGANLDEFGALGEAFNANVYRSERRMLLDLVDGSDPDDLGNYRMGRPFPYVSALQNIPPLSNQPNNLAANEEEYRPICIGGFEEGGGG